VGRTWSEVAADKRKWGEESRSKKSASSNKIFGQLKFFH